jgi:hypothetical protein
MRTGGTFGTARISTTYKGVFMIARRIEQVVARFPIYPDTKKSEHAYQELQYRVGPIVYQTWISWLKWLSNPFGRRRYLIRLPGGQYAQPRGKSDWIYHVGPKTPKPKKKKPTLAEEITAANQRYVTKFQPSNPFK